MMGIIALMTIFTGISHTAGKRDYTAETAGAEPHEQKYDHHGQNKLDNAFFHT